MPVHMAQLSSCVLASATLPQALPPVLYCALHMGCALVNATTRVVLPCVVLQMAQLLGCVFLCKSEVNLLSCVLDTPEFFWRASDALRALYDRVGVGGCAQFEAGADRAAGPGWPCAALYHMAGAQSLEQGDALRRAGKGVMGGRRGGRAARAVRQGGCAHVMSMCLAYSAQPASRQLLRRCASTLSWRSGWPWSTRAPCSFRWGTTNTLPSNSCWLLSVLNCLPWAPCFAHAGVSSCARTLMPISLAHLNAPLQTMLNIWSDHQHHHYVSAWQPCWPMQPAGCAHGHDLPQL